MMVKIFFKKDVLKKLESPEAVFKKQVKTVSDMKNKMLSR